MVTSNLAFVAANIVIAATILAVIAVAAMAIHRIVALPNQPVGYASALALSIGGFGMIIFLFAAAGLLEQPMWWVFAALLHLGIAGGAAWAVPRPSSSGDMQTNHSQDACAAVSRDGWRIAPALAFLAWVVAFDLLKCFEPQFRGDALWYHLTLPKYWVEKSGLRPHPSLSVAGYPLLIEMIYTVPVSCGLPFAARITHLAFGVGVVLAIYGWLRSRLSPAGAMAFSVAFFLFDSVNEVATWANTDLGRTFFLVCAAACLATYMDWGRRRDLVVAAALSGLAMSTHYLAIVFGNGLLTIALIATRVHRGQDAHGTKVRAGARQIARDLAVFWLVSLAVFAPWLAKNLIHYGQPFYGLKGTNLRLPGGKTLTDFFFGNVSFVAAVIVALWFFARRDSGDGVRLLAVYLVAYLVVGAFELPPIMRFFLPVYGVGLMLLGRAAAPLLSGRRPLELALSVALLVIGIAMTCYQWRHHLYDAPMEFIFHNKPPASTIIWHQ